MRDGGRKKDREKDRSEREKVRFVTKKRVSKIRKRARERERV